jgi:hypothetical protein
MNAFIEVYSEEDKNKLLERGMRLFKEEPRDKNIIAYIFINDSLKFANSDVKRFRITNYLNF